MYEVAEQQAASVRDDQQIFVRYAHMHPESISMDKDRALFATNYKEVRGITIDLTRDLNMVVTRTGHKVFAGVGVLHCNNLKSSSLYHLYVTEVMIHLLNQHFLHSLYV